MHHHYLLPSHSPLGRSLTLFWRAATKAARAADAYARKVGATSYIQPFDTFEGGVEFLEFATPPDPNVWRRRVSSDGVDEYEPNCMVSMLIEEVSKDIPKDTFDRTYHPTILHWPQVKGKRTLRQWADRAGLSLTGNLAQDEASVDTYYTDRLFVTGLHFHGPDRAATRLSRPLRKAIRAEKDRLALPTVSVESLLQLLQAAPADKDGSALATPIFFLHDGDFYIRTQFPCGAPDLFAISDQAYALHYYQAQHDQ